MQKIFSSNLIKVGLLSILLVVSVFLTLFNFSVAKAEGIVVGPDYECVNCTYAGSTVKCNDPTCLKDGNYAVYNCYDSCNNYSWVDDGKFLGCVDVCS